jgi:hypothetical protein
VIQLLIWRLEEHNIIQIFQKQKVNIRLEKKTKNTQIETNQKQKQETPKKI